MSTDKNTCLLDTLKRNREFVFEIVIIKKKRKRFELISRI